MIRPRILPLLSLLALFGSSGPAFAEEWGNLTGRFLYNGTPPKPVAISITKDPEICGLHKIVEEGLVVNDKGEIANVVVMLKTKNVPIAPMYSDNANGKVELDNKNCTFVPHVLVLRNSQTLLIKNSDPVSHNTKIDPANNPTFNQTLPIGGDPFTFKVPTEEGTPIKVACSIHTWMGAWIVARKDPYAAVSDATGKFTIQELPVGTELEFALWQEKAGNLRDVTFKGGKADSKGRFKYKIKPGDNDLGDIKLPAAMFSGK